MLHIGLTGGIGSGKSTVAKMFARRGAVVMDADAIVRELLQADTEATRRVAEAFGPGVLAPDGAVDRKAVSALVFTDTQRRRTLEGILHPLVIARRREMLHGLRMRYGTGTLVVTEAALIFEASTEKEFDHVILVTAPLQVRRTRLLAAGWAPDEIDRRMAAQWPDSMKAPLARWVVDNGESPDETHSQVMALWPVLQELARAAR